MSAASSCGIIAAVTGSPSSMCASQLHVRSVTLESPRTRNPTTRRGGSSASAGNAVTSTTIATTQRKLRLLLLLAREDSHQLADDTEHDLVGATADREQPRVAIRARRDVLPRKAHPAPVLQAT